MTPKFNVHAHLELLQPTAKPVCPYCFSNLSIDLALESQTIICNNKDCAQELLVIKNFVDKHEQSMLGYV